MRSEVLPTATHGKGQWAEQTSVMRLPQPGEGAGAHYSSLQTSIMTQKKKDVGKVLGAQATLGQPSGS